jgi:hypothetical protein
MVQMTQQQRPRISIVILAGGILTTASFLIGDGRVEEPIIGPVTGELLAKRVCCGGRL